MNMSEQLHQQLVTFILLINEKIVKQFAYTYKDGLTTSQFYVVATLNSYGRMTMSALADKLGMQKQQATKIANQLVEIHFLRRIYDKADRRIIMVELTEKAKTYVEEYSAENMNRISQSFDSLAESELAELQSALEIFNKILPHVAVKGKNKLQ